MAHAVCAEAEMNVGNMREFNVGGENILLYRLSDGYYATQPRCSHLFFPLKRGQVLDDCRVRCSFHRAEFDIRTGAVDCWACFPPGVQLLNVLRSEKALKTYPVNVIDGTVYVEID